MLKTKAAFFSKLNWLGLLTLISGLVEFLLSDTFVAQYPQVVAILTSISGALVIVFRFFTNRPVTLTGQPVPRSRFE